MVLLALFVLLIAVPLLEIYLVIQIGQAIGVIPTLALLVLDAMLGTLLMRSQSRAVWRRARQALRSGRAPGREVLDGALIIAGGALLIAPGFLTDLLGALLLLPPSRAVIRRLIVRRFTHRIPAIGSFTQPGRQSTQTHVRHDYDVEGSASEIDPDELGQSTR
jgi:UPF0716 protein FxsA